MRAVGLTPGARRDLSRLEEFLSQKNERAALAAVGAITGGILSLAELSERGRAVPGSPWRELIVRFGRDGYVLRYRVTVARVIVVRIFHAREQR